MHGAWLQKHPSVRVRFVHVFSVLLVRTPVQGPGSHHQGYNPSSPAMELVQLRGEKQGPVHPTSVPLERTLCLSHLQHHTPASPALGTTQPGHSDQVTSLLRCEHNVSCRQLASAGIRHLHPRHLVETKKEGLPTPPP